MCNHESDDYIYIYILGVMKLEREEKQDKRSQLLFYITIINMIISTNSAETNFGIELVGIDFGYYIIYVY